MLTEVGGGLAGLSLNRSPLRAPGGVNPLSLLQAYSSIEVMSRYSILHSFSGGKNCGVNICALEKSSLWQDGN